MRLRKHAERHFTARISWLRAAVLGANDGVVSTASLILGVATAHASRTGILVTGAAGLVAGAMSMAAGEYVSVHSQADIEDAELAKEQLELHTDSEGEQRELAAIYVARGLDADLAGQVARQLMAHNALEAHARDELGITDALRARPLQAALASALSFSVGAAFPMLVVALVPSSMLIASVFVGTLVFLLLLGGTAARVGGASLYAGALRVGFWGALAMGTTAAVGALIGRA